MFRLLFVCAAALATAGAQQMNQPDNSMFLMTLASGTRMNPESWPMPMLMRVSGDWMLMFMGQAFLLETQQTGPRGADKLYSTNYGMFRAEHDLGGGTLMFDLMVSLEPATITQGRYPELFSRAKPPSANRMSTSSIRII